MGKIDYRLILGVVCSALLSGCGSHLFMYRVENARGNIQSAYDSLDQRVDIDTTVTLENVKIRIIGDRDKFLNRYGLDPSVKGYVTIGSDDSAEIYLIGYHRKGKIIVNPVVLGHEINHILNRKNSRIADPDAMEALFR